MISPDQIKKVAQEIEPSVKPEWFQAYMEGNMRLPQAFFGISIFVLNSILSDEVPEMDRYITSELSRDQIQKMKDMMHSAHAQNHIPAATQDKSSEIGKKIEAEGGNLSNKTMIEFPDNKLVHLWEDTVRSTTQLLNSFIKANNGSSFVISHPRQENRIIYSKQDLESSMHNIDILKKLRSAFSLAVEALRSEKGKQLSATYRDVFNLRKHGQPNIETSDYFVYLNDKSRDARRAVLNFIDEYIKEKDPDLPSIIDSIT